MNKLKVNLRTTDIDETYFVLGEDGSDTVPDGARGYINISEDDAAVCIVEPEDVMYLLLTDDIMFDVNDEAILRAIAAYSVVQSIVDALHEKQSHKYPVSAQAIEHAITKNDRKRKLWRGYL